jgi:hypothetical protein
MSGHDIHNVCQHAEHHWASKVYIFTLHVENKSQTKGRSDIFVIFSVKFLISKSVQCQNNITSTQNRVYEGCDCAVILGPAGNSQFQELPPIEQYLECAEERQKTIVRWAHNRDSYFGVGKLRTS